MKCPKCHYLSFEPEPRCKHCGYSFALSEPDLAIRPAEDSGDSEPLADFPMRDSEVDRSRGPMTLGPMGPANPGPAGAARPSSPAATLDRPDPLPDFPAEPLRPKAARPAPTTELPLFVKGLAETEAAASDVPVAEPDQPFAKIVPVARAPLAVRRTAEAPRPQPAARVDPNPARK